MILSSISGYYFRDRVGVDRVGARIATLIQDYLLAFVSDMSGTLAAVNPHEMLPPTPGRGIYRG